MNEFSVIAFLVLLFFVAISTFSFSRLSMSRIQKEIKRDQLPDALMFDFMGGGGAVEYAFAIVLPEKMANRLSLRIIDAELIRRYTTKRDRWRALAFLGSFQLFLIFILISYVFDL